jgi:hypothetical protein
MGASVFAPWLVGIPIAALGLTFTLHGLSHTPQWQRLFPKAWPAWQVAAAFTWGAAILAVSAIVYSRATVEPNPLYSLTTDGMDYFLQQSRTIPPRVTPMLTVRNASNEKYVEFSGNYKTRVAGKKEEKSTSTNRTSLSPGESRAIPLVNLYTEFIHGRPFFIETELNYGLAGQALSYSLSELYFCASDGDNPAKVVCDIQSRTRKPLR